jgi:cell division protein FtsI/penicillin-binding protein 2
MKALIPYTFFIVFGIIIIGSLIYLAVVKHNEKKQTDA